MNLLDHERDRVGDFQNRVLIHIPIGIIIAMAWFAHWSITFALVYVFVRYEENEDAHISDEAWKDYFGCMVGIVIGGIISAIIKIFMM